MTATSAAAPADASSTDPAASAAQLTDKLESLRLEVCKLDDFDIGRVLGTGSFGRVSLARHRQSGATVAVKALSKAHIVKKQQIAHLRR